MGARSFFVCRFRLRSAEPAGSDGAAFALRPATLVPRAGRRARSIEQVARRIASGGVCRCPPSKEMQLRAQPARDALSARAASVSRWPTASLLKAGVIEDARSIIRPRMALHSADG